MIASTPLYSNFCLNCSGVKTSPFPITGMFTASFTFFMIFQSATKTTETTTGGITTTTKEVITEDQIKFSAQIAKRFHDATLRGGIIESTGGFGVDYYLFNDRLKLTLEAFDFDKKRNPRVKTAATYNINKYFFVTGGYDDVISKVGGESLFIGAGFHFEDEDIKYLLTSAPIPTR